MNLSPLSRKILLCVVFLSGLGLVQVYSSSYIFATETFENGSLFFTKQLLFTVIGMAGLFVVSQLSWPHARFLGICLWFISVLGLVLTLIPEISVKIGGSQRWLKMPLGFRFQPSEWFRVTCPFAFIYFIALKEKWPLNMNLYWLICAFSFGLPALVLILQPDFGSMMLIFCLIFSLFFILGLKRRYVLGILLASILIVFALVAGEPYRAARIRAFLDPWEDPLGAGFQVIQSLLSFHSGGFFGQGLGQGQSKLFFLPEAHTDFTLAVLGEELGFIGFVFILLMYGCLGFYGMKVVFKTEDLAKRITAFSMVFLFLTSAVIHFGVNLGILPPTGLVLPFLSYGGNALVCSLLSFGWLIQIENSNTS